MNGLGHVLYNLRLHDYILFWVYALGDVPIVFEDRFPFEYLFLPTLQKSMIYKLKNGG